MKRITKAVVEERLEVVNRNVFYASAYKLIVRSQSLERTIYSVYLKYKDIPDGRVLRLLFCGTGTETLIYLQGYLDKQWYMKEPF